MKKLFSKLLLAGLLAASFNSYAAAPSVSCTLSASTVTAPGGVFNDCTGTTGVTMHTGLFTHDWGDTASGVFQYGAYPGISKNQSSGIVAAHVYETAGSYPVVTTVCNSSNECASVTNTVTVVAANTTFNQAATKCFYQTTPSGDCPNGGTETQNADFDVALSGCIGVTKRCLFQRGSTFTASQQSSITANGPWQIGAYGSGAKPIVTSSFNGTVFSLSSNGTPTVSDFAIYDLNINGGGGSNAIGISGGGSFSQLTLLRVDIHDVSFAVSLDPAILDLYNNVGTTTIRTDEAAGQTVIDVVCVTGTTCNSGMVAGQGIQIMQNNGNVHATTIVSTGGGPTVTITDPLLAGANTGLAVSFYTLTDTPSDPMWDKVFIQDSTFTSIVGDESTGHNALYAASKRLAFLGNLIDPVSGGEHGFRSQYLYKGVIDSNTIQGISPSKTNMTLRGQPFGGTSTLNAGSYTELIMVSNNQFIGGESVGMVSTGAKNEESNERMRNQVWERNYLLGGATTTNYADLYASSLTVRNNLFVAGSSLDYNQFIIIGGSSITPTPQNVFVYNNTGYSAASAPNSMYMINLKVGDTMTVKNNLLYAPNAGKGNTLVITPGVTNVTASNNTNDFGDASPNTTTNPSFSGPLTTAKGFRVSGGSYAANGGAVAYPATYRDQTFCYDVTGVYRIGAFVPLANASCDPQAFTFAPFK